MLPIKDYNPTTSRSIVVPVIIAINIVVFFFWEPFSFGATTTQQQTNFQVKQAIFFACQASIPYELSHRTDLASAPPAVQPQDIQEDVFIEQHFCPHKNIWLSILYTMFLHGSLLHIGGNMLFLWIFGNNIEDRLGKLRFILFYLLCGLVATYAQTFVSPSSGAPQIGASGAIAGVLGAYIVLFPRARIRTLFFFFLIFFLDVPAIVMLGLWFALQLLQGVGPGATSGGVAYMAHVGGFIAGMILLFVFRPRSTAPPR
ncbi:MAG TPA: rhomboid family intramembrane serine protease, partial [Actinomycetota bacterium]|nr:rhomboid family intramembrane serine protease [Actinomycetota bacterium]